MRDRTAFKINYTVILAMTRFVSWWQCYFWFVEYFVYFFCFMIVSLRLCVTLSMCLNRNMVDDEK